MTVGTAAQHDAKTDARAVLFDMGGVLLPGSSTEPAVYDRATDRAIEALGADPTADQGERLRTFEWAAVTGACDELDVNARNFWGRRDGYATELAIGRIRSGDRSLYDCLPAVRELADTRPCALVSNNRHCTVESPNRITFGSVGDYVSGKFG